jgi:hypothetical protein
MSLERLREAAAELQAAVTELRRLADERGQHDDERPLLIDPSDTEFVAAVDRELLAHERVRAAIEARSR